MDKVVYVRKQPQQQPNVSLCCIACASQLCSVVNGDYAPCFASPSSRGPFEREPENNSTTNVPFKGMLILKNSWEKGYQGVALQQQSFL